MKRFSGIAEGIWETVVLFPSSFLAVIASVHHLISFEGVLRVFALVLLKVTKSKRKSVSLLTLRRRPQIGF